jgi:hypothetical protein
MSKAVWITSNPSSGTGTKTVSVSGQNFTGRVERTTTLTITSTKDTTKKATVTAKQTALSEFLTLKTSDGNSIPATASIIIYAFESNSKYICLRKDSGYTASDVIVFNIPEIQTAEGAVTGVDKGSFILYTIPSDYGASSKYTIQIGIGVKANETISPIKRKFTLGAVSGASEPTSFPTALTVQTTSVQAAKVVTLNVSPTSITIPAAGTAQTITVTSNDAWTIS